MRSNITVAAQAREERGKNEARRLRASGKLPGVLYGPGGDPQAVAVDPRQIQKILESPAGHNTIFKVSLGSEIEASAMIVDWQLEPIKDRLLHVDLQRIDPNKRLRIKVPVNVHGSPVGVKLEGGLMEIITREVNIECLPDDIPEHLDTDVSQLHLGQSVRASDLALEGSAKLLDPPETVIAHIVMMRAAETVAAEAEAEPAPTVAPAAPAPEAAKKK